MDGRKLKDARRRKGWSGQEAARRLGVSQAYLSMLENGKRRLTPKLARKVMRVFDLPASVLTPGELSGEVVDAQTLVEDMAALGYPGFAYLSVRRPRKNPGGVLLTALAQEKLEARLVEALPWLLLKFWDMDTLWLLEQAKLHDLQNRLGFVVALARQLAERSGSPQAERDAALQELEEALYRSRLAEENTLCRQLTEPERRWLEQNRPAEAARWNLLTNWQPEHLPYAG